MSRIRACWLLGLSLAVSACGGKSDGEDLFGPGQKTSDPHPAVSGGGVSSGGAPSTGGVPSSGGTGGVGGSTPVPSGGVGGTGGFGTGGVLGTGATAGFGGTFGNGGSPSTGQCAGACGMSSADGSCWCDELCKTYGDCCADFVAACPTQANAKLGLGCTPQHCQTGEATSQGNPPTACYCDAACTEYNDCCSNKLQICGS